MTVDKIQKTKKCLRNNLIEAKFKSCNLLKQKENSWPVENIQFTSEIVSLYLTQSQSKQNSQYRLFSTAEEKPNIPTWASTVQQRWGKPSWFQIVFQRTVFGANFDDHLWFTTSNCVSFKRYMGYTFMLAEVTPDWYTPDYVLQNRFF